MEKILFYFNRIREQLWFRPFILCLLSVGGALIAHQADRFEIAKHVPEIDAESLGSLLDTISASMLVIAIFAVASMLSAFASASTTATPRSFKIVVTDDVSQNALSIFIGAFIFSIVATIALDHGYYEKAGKFILFLLTLILFSTVILTFLKWVNRISRLGRMDHTISQIEAVVSKSLSSYIKHPHHKGQPAKGEKPGEIAVLATAVGYVQYLQMESLQTLAEENGLTIRVTCLPGKFVHKNYTVAYISPNNNVDLAPIMEKLNEAITIGNTRLFDDDPRFGLIALSEIASRALSPGVNDPGTAIQIIGSHERLFFLWNQKQSPAEGKVEFDRIEVPDIVMEDFFDDAFRPIARDGADNVEVMLRMQKAFAALATIDKPELKEWAIKNSKLAFQRAEQAITFKPDLELLERNCLFKNLGR
ncbi:DUF2254 domain-containing protein [Algoriphagus jejuensis]|uniref:DUF2254 domain-containing protein n=1 Tax=Algoriphagus jejuensis TaxID=419934 RepID=A0ABN1MUK9_9BACT